MNRESLLTEQELVDRIKSMDRGSNSNNGWGISISAVAIFVGLSYERIKAIEYWGLDAHIRPSERIKLSRFFRKYEAGKLDVYRFKYNGVPHMVHLREGKYKPKEYKQPMKFDITQGVFL